MPIIQIPEKGMVVQFPDDMSPEEIEREIYSGVFNTPVLTSPGEPPGILDRISQGVSDFLQPPDPGVGPLTEADRRAFAPANPPDLIPSPSPTDVRSQLTGAGRTLENIGQVYPALETAASFITSTYGLPAAGLAGLVAGAASGPSFDTEAAQRAMDATTQALVYQPQTQRGGEMTEAAFYPFEKLHELGQQNAEFVYRETGDPDLAALAATGIEGSFILLHPMKNGMKRLGKMVRENAEMGRRLAEVPERNLVVQSLAETLEKNPKMTEADLIKRSQQYYKEAMERRGAGKAQPAPEAAGARAQPEPAPAVQPKPEPVVRQPKTDLAQQFKAELDAQRPQQPTGFAAFQQRIKERMQQAEQQVDQRSDQALAAMAAVEGLPPTPEPAAALPQPEAALPPSPLTGEGRGGGGRQIGMEAVLRGQPQKTDLPESPRTPDQPQPQALPLPQVPGQIPQQGNLPSSFQQAAAMDQVGNLPDDTNIPQAGDRIGDLPDDTNIPQAGDRIGDLPADSVYAEPEQKLDPTYYHPDGAIKTMDEIYGDEEALNPSRKVVIRGDESQLEVDAEPVDLFPWVDAVVHKDVPDFSTGEPSDVFVVTDAKTGMAIARNKHKIIAIEQARGRLEQTGQKKFEKMVSQIMKRQGVEPEQAQAAQTIKPKDILTLPWDKAGDRIQSGSLTKNDIRLNSKGKPYSVDRFAKQYAAKLINSGEIGPRSFVVELEDGKGFGIWEDKGQGAEWGAAATQEPEAPTPQPTQPKPTAAPSTSEEYRWVWTMTRDQFVESRSTQGVGDDRDYDRHRNIVAMALNEGMDVPDHVLKDYPDLAPKPELPPQETGATPSQKISAYVANNIGPDKEPISWQEMTYQATLAYDGNMADGKFEHRDMYDAMETGVAEYIRTHPTRFDPRRNDPTQAAADISDLQQNVSAKLPTQSKRSAEQDAFQQYTTPPALAYAATWVGNPKPNDVVLEPSAGTGGILVFPKVAGVKQTIGNEISPRRADLLRETGVADRVFTEDAEQLHNILPADVKPTLVVMNPPFSASGQRAAGKKNVMVGAKHIEQALKRLDPNGRLVAIVGRGMSDGASKFRTWWKNIKKEYNVRANVALSGKGYQKYGTSFDNRLLVIDKTGPTTGEIVRGDLESYTEIPQLLKGVRDDRPIIQEQSRPAQQEPDQQTGGRPDEGGGVAASASPPPRPEPDRQPDSVRPDQPGQRGERPPVSAPAGRPASSSREPQPERTDAPRSGRGDTGLGRPGETPQPPAGDRPDAGGIQPGMEPERPADVDGGKGPGGYVGGREKMTPEAAAKLREEGVVPDGWFVHGRAMKQELGSMAQLTTDWDVAEQYAGSKGSEWMIRPRPDAVVLDMRDPDVRDSIRSKLQDQYDAGEINQADIYDAIEQNGDNALDAFPDDQINPENIVDSAAWFDSPQFLEWLYDNFDAEFFITEDGGVSIGDENIEAVRLPSREEGVSENQDFRPETPSPISPDPEPVRERASDFSDSLYDAYEPQIHIKGKPHPTPLVESSAMATVEAPPTTYKPDIPKAAIDKGNLSGAQLEAIVRAGENHDRNLPDGRRRGFFIGDGTGVGKGREIAGIIWDNWNKGRKKAVWLSKGKNLLSSAKRDLSGAGWKDGADKIFSPKANERIAMKEGILFSTYDTLRSGFTSIREDQPETWNDLKVRLNQFVDWLGEDFDGVIAFDEAHRMGNALPMQNGRGTTQPSMSARAGTLLQRMLPNARIVYVSATGATEARNLAYAERLPLWGEGTPWDGPVRFVNDIASSGVAAMEIVAQNLKSMGAYTARSLSYDGVGYDRLTHALTEEQSEVYNKLAEAWQVTLRNFQEALELTEAGGSNGEAAAKSAFWGANQRFWEAIVTTMQMPSVIKDAKARVADGDAVIFQLTKTGEAQQERALSRATDAADLEDLDLTPKDALIGYVENSFPTQQWEEYFNPDTDAMEKRPVVDSNGKPVHNQEALAKKEQLLDELSAIQGIPPSPLDSIIDAFGPDQVAEVTGRKRRLVYDPDSGERIIQKMGASFNAKEIRAFMDDKKQILVFSEAGGTGESYHADRAAKNKRPRVHYLVQPGWRADAAVQGLGRSHRSNQAQPPKFVLAETDLKGHRRFISTIARRLDQLGALTKGERRTGSQGLFTALDNLETSYAQDALNRFIGDIAHGRVPEIDPERFQEQTGIEMIDSETREARAPTVAMKQFLNRILSMTIEDQNTAFDKFMERYEEILEWHRQQGTLDTGIQTIRGDAIRKVNQTSLYKDPDSAAEAFYVHLQVDWPTSRVPWKSVKNAPRFVVNKRSKRVWAVIREAERYDPERGVSRDYSQILSPNNTKRWVMTRTELLSKFDSIEKGEAASAWKVDYNALPSIETSDLHMVTGAILPIWDRLTGASIIKRAMTDDGEKFLGREIHPDHIDETLERLGVDAAGGRTVKEYTPAQIVEAAMDDGGRVTLDNGWGFKSSRVSGEERLELTGVTSLSDMRSLQDKGLMMERIAHKARYFVPLNNAEEVVGRIMRGRSVSKIKGKSGGGTTLYSGIPIHRFGEAKKALEDLYTDNVGTPIWNFLTSLPEKAGERYQVIDAINRGLITDYRKPEEYIRLRDETEQKIHNARQKAKALADFLKTFPRAEQVRISQIIKGSITTNPERYAKVFEIQKQFQDLERDLKALGVLGKDTYLTKLSKKELAAKSNEIREIDEKINGLKRKLKPIVMTRWKTKKLAEKVTETVTSAAEEIGARKGDYEAKVTKWSQMNEDRIREALTARGFGTGEADQMIERVKASVVPIEGKTMEIKEIRERIEKVVEKSYLKIKETEKTYSPSVMARARGSIVKDMNKLRKQRDEIVERIRRHYKTSGELYLRRAYEVIENEQGFLEHLKRLVRPRLFKGYTERRKDLSPEYRKKVLQEIEEAPYLVYKGLSEETHDRELAKYFSRIAENPEWAVSPEEYGKAPEKYEGFKPLPASPNLGKLSGWMVDPYIWDDLNQTVEHRTAMGKVYDEALRLWKTGKVVYNPASQVRNMMSNFILADWAGLPPHRVDVWSRAARDMLTKSGYYEEAMGTPLMGTEWAGTEVKQFLQEAAEMKDGTVFDRASAFVRRMADMPGKSYQGVEQWAKTAVYAKARMDGMSVEDAYRHAEKWLFNYNKVPPAIRWAKRWYSPFITFMFKAMPRMAETAVRRPWKMAKYLMLMAAVEEIGRALMGESEEEIEREKRVLPEYMRKSVGPGQLSHLRLPYKDKHGRSKYLDLSYILPWGDVAEQWGQTRIGFRPALPNNPLFMTMAEIATNQSAFTGRELTDKDLDDNAEWSYKIGRHIWRQAMPSLAGSWSFDKLMSAYYGDTDWAGRERSMTEAIFDVFLGLKIRSIDYNEEIGKRLIGLKGKINDAKRRFARDYRRETLTRAARPGHEKRIKDIYKDLDEDLETLMEKIRYVSGDDI